MATKYFCDVCCKEVPVLAYLSIRAYAEHRDGSGFLVSGDICEQCLGLLPSQSNSDFSIMVKHLIKLGAADETK